MTVKDFFGTDASEVTEERILWHFENCFKETEDVGECALSELPKEWETLLWKNYSREDVIKKYKEDYEEAMTVYNASTRYPYDDFFVYHCLKEAFLDGWKSAMVLQWVDEGYFDEAEKKEIKKMYFDVAMLG